MPQFSYKALDSNKKVIEGNLAAKNKEEAAQDLNKKNLSPLLIKEVSESITFSGKLPEIEKITFCRYLSVMLSSGLSLSEGIEVLYRESKNPLMRKILGDMRYSLEQGQELSTVFTRYPEVFEPYFLTLVRAGEMSGKLAEVFKYLETQLRSDYSMKSKIKGALLYPTIIFMAMIGIGTMMFFFVLPQIGKVFLSLKLPLPAITKWLFTVSISLSKQMVPILLGAILTVAAIFFALKKPQVRNLLFFFIRPLPLVRNLIKKIDLARFTRIFSTLLKSAVPITEALAISLKSLSWYEFRQLSEFFPEEIRKGKSLSSVFKKQSVFPSLVIQMIAAGEKTGTLDLALSDLATFYEEEVEDDSLVLEG